jgi:hypothetical protein
VGKATKRVNTFSLEIYRFLTVELSDEIRTDIYRELCVGCGLGLLRSPADSCEGVGIKVPTAAFVRVFK